MKPAKHILDPTFRYRPSYATDIRKTFERALEALPQQPVIAPTSKIVVQLRPDTDRHVVTK